MSTVKQKNGSLKDKSKDIDVRIGAKRSREEAEDLDGNIATSDILSQVSDDEEESDASLSPADNDIIHSDSSDSEDSFDGRRSGSEPSKKKQKVADGTSHDTTSTESKQSQPKSNAAVVLSQGGKSILRLLIKLMEDGATQDVDAVKAAATAARSALEDPILGPPGTVNADEVDDQKEARGPSKSVPEGSVSIRRWFNAMQVFELQPAGVQVRLLWQLIKLHGVETGGTGSKKIITVRAPGVEMPTNVEDKEFESLTKRVLMVPDFAKPSSHSISKLSPFVRQVIGKYVKHKLCYPVNSVPGAPNRLDKGSPYVLAICQSTARCEIVAKELKKIGTPAAQLLKLYSHDSPINEAIRKTKSTDVRVAVGTPMRLLRLLEKSALHLRRCELVIVDCARDVKTMSVLTANFVRDDFVELWEKHVRPIVGGVRGTGLGATAKIVFF